MLQYRENYLYSPENALSLQDELAELVSCLHFKDVTADVIQLYEAIRKRIYREIIVEDLAATLIIKDLYELRLKNYKAANIISYFICNNDLSYREIASYFGCSKQNVYQTLKIYAKQFNWLANLMTIKGLQDKRNENNRSKRFEGKPRKTIQTALFE